MNTLRATLDVGSRFHQVTIGDGSRRLLDEFQIDHGRAGFEQFLCAAAAMPLRTFGLQWRLATVGVKKLSETI
ncbi:MAG: hypothetical protein ABI114_08570 [Rhodanobacter sp.]